jgi:hypothetical protein
MDQLRSDRRALRSQNIFLNFADRSFGQFFDEGHTVRRLEVRDVRPRKLAQLVFIDARVFLQNNKGVWRLAPAFMWESVNRNCPTADPKSRLLSRGARTWKASHRAVPPRSNSATLELQRKTKRN